MMFGPGGNVCIADPVPQDIGEQGPSSPESIMLVNWDGFQDVARNTFTD